MTFELGVTWTSDHSMLEAETGGLRIQDQPWLNSNVLFKERKSASEMELIVSLLPCLLFTSLNTNHFGRVCQNGKMKDTG